MRFAFSMCFGLLIAYVLDNSFYDGVHNRQFFDMIHEIVGAFK